MLIRTLARSCALAVSFSLFNLQALAAPEVRDPAQVQKRLPPLPAAAPADYPRDATLAVIRDWLKNKQLDAAKKRMRPGDDVVASHAMAQLLPESDWLILVDRAAADIGSDDPQVRKSAYAMAMELQQTSFQAPSLRGPLGAKVFPAAVKRLGDLPPEESKQLPGIVMMIAPSAAPDFAIPALINLSSSPDENVRRAAIMGLSSMVIERETPIQLSPEQRIAVADALFARVTDDDERVRGMAISTIGHLKPPADPYVAKLAALLDSKDDRTRYAAMQAVGEYGPAAGAATPALIRLIQSPSKRDRMQACFALRGLGPAAKDAVPDLTKLLDSDDRYDRTSAASALGAIGSAAQDALPKLDALGANKADQASVEYRNAAAKIRDAGGK